MGLYTGGLIFGGAYLWNGVNVSNLMGYRRGGLYSGGLIFGGGLYSEVYGNLWFITVHKHANTIK